MQGDDAVLLGHQNDGGGFQPGWYSSMCQGEVKDVGENLCKLMSAVPEHPAWDPIWTCSLHDVDSSQSSLNLLYLVSGSEQSAGVRLHCPVLKKPLSWVPTKWTAASVLSSSQAK